MRSRMLWKGGSLVLLVLLMGLVFLVFVSERLDAISILGEVVEASDYIFTGCYIEGQKYGNTLIEAKTETRVGNPGWICFHPPPMC